MLMVYLFLILKYTTINDDNHKIVFKTTYDIIHNFMFLSISSSVLDIFLFIIILITMFLIIFKSFVHANNNINTTITYGNILKLYDIIIMIVLLDIYRSHNILNIVLCLS